MMAAFVTICVAAPITHFVAAEMGVLVIDGVFSALRSCAMVAVMHVEAIIYVAAEVATTVEPGTSSYEDSAVEPLGSVIAVGGALVGCVVIVSVGAYRRRPDLDRDLCVGAGSWQHEKQSGCC